MIPNSVLNQYLDCSDCVGTLRVSDAFGIAFSFWPQQMWIAYRCPTCDTVNHIALKSNSITQGYLNGAPDLLLIPTRTIHIPNLSLRSTNDGIQIKTLNLSLSIPASS